MSALKMLQICNTLPSHRSHIWLCVIYLRFLDDCLWEKETNLHVRYFCSDWNQCFIMRRQHFNIYTSVLISQDVIYIFNACDDSYVYRMHKYFPKTRALDTEMRTFGTQKNHPQLERHWLEHINRRLTIHKHRAVRGPKAHSNPLYAMI